jgi:hypothetical protein
MMRSFLSRLFTWFAILSFVFSVLAAGIWVRSSRTTDLFVRTLPVSHADPQNTDSPVVFYSTVYGCSEGRIFTASRTMRIEADVLRESGAPSEGHYLTVPTSGYDRRTLPENSEPPATFAELPIWPVVVLTGLLPVAWIVMAVRRRRRWRTMAVGEAIPIVGGTAG